MLRPASAAIRLEFVTEARGGWPAVVSNYRQLQSRKMIFEITDYTLAEADILRIVAAQAVLLDLSHGKPMHRVAQLCIVHRNSHVATNACHGGDRLLN